MIQPQPQDSPPGDEELMRKVSEGDERAFAALVRRHTQKFYALALRLCGDAQEAEDIVQDCFVKLWSGNASWKTDMNARFTTWFYRIVTNACLDHLRRQKRRVVMPDADGFLDSQPDSALDADDAMIMDEEQAALEEAMAALPERQRAALELCVYEEMSNKEAADVLGVGVKALESLLSRARAALKADLPVRLAARGHSVKRIEKHG